MSRILKAYRTRFHQILKQVGARKIDQGVEWLVCEAQKRSVRERMPLSQALTSEFERLVARPRLRGHKPAPPRTPGDITFFCDAGLGGLARWLRAAGYDALWEAGIDDDVLLAKSRQADRTVLTTDSMLMERRVLRDEVISSMWLPPTLSIADQLARVFLEFNLQVGSPRCMSCGGHLKPVQKEELGDRIPPRTYRWLNDYFLCTQCGKVFWHGTHWLSIVRQLQSLTTK